uniref:Opsin 8, group member c n=1 Tax=Tetraodon nigroviridis TaxID=99883 RepID=H3C2I1_TETNG
ARTGGSVLPRKARFPHHLFKRNADSWSGLSWMHESVALFSTTVKFLLSAVGNGMVLLTYQRSRKRMGASVVLYVNLALADLSCCTLFYPVSIASYFQHAWQGGSASCAYCGFGYHVLSLCSMLTVTAISSLRYLKVCNYSFYAVWTKAANMQKTCCFIWLVAAVWSSFPLLGWGKYILEPPGLSCIVGGGDNQTSVSDTVYVVCSFSLFTLIPFLIIVVPQCQIICTVARASCQVSGERIRNRMNRIEKRLTWMFFCVSLGFVMAWFPYTMVSFLFFFNKGHQYMALWGFVILGLLAKFSHVYNPFIYFFINLGF